MELFHTSSEVIQEITSFGTFGECLFFSSDVYAMSKSANVVYSIDIDENEIIEAHSFFYRDDCHLLDGLVLDVMELASCDEETAQNLLSQDETYHDDYEIDWEIQGLTGMAAKLLGYKAAESVDEQGAVYIVPMLGKERDLILN